MIIYKENKFNFEYINYGNALLFYDIIMCGVIYDMLYIINNLKNISHNIKILDM